MAGSGVMGIGDIIWRFDENHRVYKKLEPFRSSGSPIYREHWRPVEITGKTSRSWLAGRGHKPWKIPQSGSHPGWCFSEAEVDDQCWLFEHRYHIERAVGRVTDAALLRQIAALIGWKPGAV